LADIVTGIPDTMPESLDEGGAVEKKRPVYVLAHHPSPMSVRHKDLKL
jgi:hypothetical protein